MGVHGSVGGGFTRAGNVSDKAGKQCKVADIGARRFSGKLPRRTC